MTSRLPRATSSHAREIRAVACECEVRRLRWFDLGDVVTLAIASGACVLALWTLGLNAERQLHERTGYSKVDIAQLTASKYAYEAYPDWHTMHPDERCPASLRELTLYMDTRDTRDPWGQPYEMHCGMHGIVVHSLGEDAVAGTADDLWSNR